MAIGLAGPAVLRPTAGHFAIRPERHNVRAAGDRDLPRSGRRVSAKWAAARPVKAAMAMVVEAGAVETRAGMPPASREGPKARVDACMAVRPRMDSVGVARVKVGGRAVANSSGPTGIVRASVMADRAFSTSMRDHATGRTRRRARFGCTACTLSLRRWRTRPAGCGACC